MHIFHVSKISAASERTALRVWRCTYHACCQHRILGKRKGTALLTGGLCVRREPARVRLHLNVMFILGGEEILCLRILASGIELTLLCACYSGWWHEPRAWGPKVRQTKVSYSETLNKANFIQHLRQFILWGLRRVTWVRCLTTGTGHIWRNIFP